MNRKQHKKIQIITDRTEAQLRTDMIAILEQLVNSESRNASGQRDKVYREEETRVYKTALLQLSQHPELTLFAKQLEELRVKNYKWIGTSSFWIEQLWRLLPDHKSRILARFWAAHNILLMLREGPENALTSRGFMD